MSDKPDGSRRSEALMPPGKVTLSFAIFGLVIGILVTLLCLLSAIITANPWLAITVFAALAGTFGLFLEICA